MAIQMIGIDHSVAAIDIRTIFSFTQKKTVEALEIIKQEKGICGCVLLSTCNRMELWVSTEEGCVIALYELLCKIRAIHNDEYQKYFTERKEEDAVQHLFRLACGLESRILGEDQILTQVKGALVTAREHYAADNVLEVLFRMAVTAGKKVRTNVTFSTGNHSVIHRALQITSTGRSGSKRQKMYGHRKRGDGKTCRNRSAAGRCGCDRYGAAVPQWCRADPAGLQAY